MSEQRFTIQNASGMYLHLPIFDNGVEMADGDVCILLNEQQATIKQLESDKAIAEDYANIFEKENVKLRIENKKLKEENEQLRQSVEYWQKKYEEGTETFQIN